MGTDSQTIAEPARETPVFLQTEVLVCGGGPAGTAAAIAAARQGARVTLLERYGCLGGLATGGLVIVLPCFREGSIQVIGGIGLELRDRLMATGEAALRVPHRSDGSAFDPEAMKRVSAELCRDEGVEVLHHVWIAQALCNDGAAKGVIVESKQGRMAVLADVVIDATGDGDVFASAGAEFATSTQYIGLPFRMIHVDTDAWQAFRQEDPKAHAALLRRAGEAAGFDSIFALSPLPTTPGVAWGNNCYLDGDGLDVRTLSRIEVDARIGLGAAQEILRTEMPGFAQALVFDTASQLGVRRSRRLVGRYVIADEDVAGAYKSFPDAIGRGNDFRKPDIVYEIPYRSLLPRDVDGLLVAGRCISCTHDALEPIREIHVCWVMGEAAGAAAALAVQRGVQPGDVPVDELQDVLRKAGVVFGEKSQQELRKLRGKVDWDGDLDAMRED